MCWTRTLRRTRRSIRSRLNRVDVAARFAPPRSAAAVEPRLPAAFRLAEAAAQFEETMGSGAVAGACEISRGRAPPFASIPTL